MTAALRSKRNGLCHRHDELLWLCERRRLYARHPFSHDREGWLPWTDTTMMSPTDAYLRLETTQYLDALNTASAAVVSNIQVGLHLDHLVSPDLLGGDACPIPRVSIKLVRPKWASRSCLCALLPSVSREQDVQARASSALSLSGLQHFPTFGFRLWCTFDDANAVAHFDVLFSS